MPQILTIESDHWRIGLVPGTGGSVASGQTKLDGAWVDVLRPTPAADLGIHGLTASYPLVPWSNRIRDGRLTWAGKEYQLRITAGDGTAIHGVGIEYPWEVVDVSGTHAVLEFRSRDVYGVNFPWSFDARFTYALDGDRFAVTMALTNTSHETFPAGIGHHPYFVRALTTAGRIPGGDAILQVNCEKSYELDNALAVAEAGPIVPRVDFREPRGLGQAFVDDCLTGRTSELAATIEYPGAVAIDMEADALLGHVVVYLPVGKDFFAVEPVSNANDAFTLDAQGVPGVGLFLLQPGQTQAASWALVTRAL